jgi:hypothetical protein
MIKGFAMIATLIMVNPLIIFSQRFSGLLLFL